MKRTTIFVPESLERDLQLYAVRVGRPTASVVREALVEYIAHRRPQGDLPSFTGAFASGHADTAERHDALLFKDLAPHERPADQSSQRAKRSHGARNRSTRKTRGA